METSETVTGIEGEIEAAEKALRAQSAKLCELRKRRPHERVRDHELVAHDGSKVKLSELFGDKTELIVVHNMGTGCPYCTMWADGFNGLAAHLQDRAAFVVVSADDPEVQKKFAASRGWKLRMLSAKGTSFLREMGFELEKAGKFGDKLPGVSSFKKTADGSVVRIAKAFFGPSDEYCATWHLFDLLEGGAGDWQARFRYD